MKNEATNATANITRTMPIVLVITGVGLTQIITIKHPNEPPIAIKATTNKVFILLPPFLFLFALLKLSGFASLENMPSNTTAALLACSVSVLSVS